MPLFISSLFAKQVSSDFLSKLKNHLHFSTKPSKWNKIIAISFLSLFFAHNAFAQQKNDSLSKKNQFSVGIGANYIKTLDFQYSTKSFQSLRKNFSLGYNRKLKKGNFSTLINIFQGNLSPTTGPSLDFYAKETDIKGVETVESLTIELKQLGVDLEICYLHKLSKFATAKKTFYFGGSLEESLTFTPAFLSIGTINFATLNTKARCDYRLNNGNSLLFGLSIPLVSLITRMPYHNSPNIPGKSSVGGFFTGNNHFETLNHFQNIRFSVKYYWLIRKSFSLNLGCDVSWLHYYRPEHLTQAGNQLSIGFTF